MENISRRNKKEDSQQMTILINQVFSYALKYLFNKPSKAFPCLASSLAISCTVSWIASRLAAFARFARSNLPAVAGFFYGQFNGQIYNILIHLFNKFGQIRSTFKEIRTCQNIIQKPEYIN